MKKLLLTLSLTMFSSLAFASFSSDVSVFSYGFMAPKQTLTIDLKGLAPHLNYDVICDNMAQNMPADVDVYYKGAEAVKLENKFESAQVFTLKKEHDPIGYRNVTFKNVNLDKSATLELTNLDDQVTVTLTRCVAKLVR